MKRSTAICICLILMFPAAGWGEGMKKFGAVLFKGLSNLSKYEIIEGVPLNRKGKLILIDTDSLKSRLSAMSLIEEFSLSSKSGNLIIEIREKSPFYSLAVKNGSETVFLEVDGRFKIIARNRLLGGTRPLIFCERKDLEGGNFSSRVMGLMESLAYIREKQKRLFREIESLSFFQGGKINVRLRGRGTRFLIEPQRENFRRLEVIGGYCDSEKKYPKEIIIESSRVVVR